jgi:hypothetical protein
VAARWLLFKFKGALFPLRSAWSLRLDSVLRSAWPLRLAFFCAWACCVVSGETPEPPFSAALGLAAALASAFLGVRASWIAIVGGDPQTFPSPLRLAWPLRLAFFCTYVDVLCCVVVGETPNLPFPLHLA